MNVFGLFKKASAAARAMTMFFPLQNQIHHRSDYQGFAREGYGQNSVVHACVREIAEAAAGVEWTLRRRGPGDEGTQLTDHPLLRLLSRPNPLQGRFEFFESVIAYLYISGNAFIEAVTPGRQESAPGPSPATPLELYALRPDRMNIVTDPVHLVGGYEYTVNGETVRFAPQNILHVRLFNPLDDWYGLSPIQVAGLAIDKMNVGDQWNAALLQNSAVPSGVLISKQHLTDDQFKRLENNMGDKYRGAFNAHKPLLLEGDLDWKEIGVSPRDMDWIEGLKLSAQQIAQVYNLPPELIGLSPATYQNRREARKALYTEVVLPALRRLRDAMNTWLVPRYGADLSLDIVTERIEALSEDRNSLWARAQKSAFLTVNEKRALVGYGPIEGGDTLATGPSSRQV